MTAPRRLEAARRPRWRPAGLGGPLIAFLLLATGCAGDIDIVFTPTPTETNTPEPSATPETTPTPEAGGTVTPPPEAPTPTSAFQDEPGAQIHAAGVALLPGTFCFDLDAGAQSPCADDQHDLWWQQVSDVERYLVPENAARLIVWGQTAPSRENCLGAPLTTDRVGASGTGENQIPAGTYLCARTSDARIAALRIITYGLDLVFEHVVWAEEA